MAVFYCEECREKNGWPESEEKSIRPCEICDRTAPCHDIPSRRLVDWQTFEPPKEKKQEDQKGS